VLFVFEDHVLDTDRRELRCADKLVAVEPQVFDLLVFLIRNREQVVSKDEIIAGVWSGRIVSESTLASRVNSVRRAVGDSGEKQQFIRTIPRKGFRFVGAVREEKAPASSAPALPSTSSAARSQEVTFCRTGDGINLALASVGTGAPMIKVANWLTHVEFDWESPIWSPLLQCLSDRCRLIRYDGRGNGLADREVAEISFDAFVRDLESVVEAAGVKQAAFMGISQGAAVAIAYAVKHPERVSKLIIYGGYAQGRNKRGDAEAEMARAFLAIMRHGWGDEHSAFMKAFSSIFLPNGSPQQVKWLVDLQRITTTAENAVRIRNTCDEIDVTALLPKVRVPTLVLHCRHDNVAPLEQGRMMAMAIPNAKFVTLESENHVVLADEPAWPRLIAEIDSFLAQ
jgi:DNA-binding winged helix-turn-helix (wHTH) protein/pimeloyl-ACP methyl ester carboxylesterase